VERPRDSGLQIRGHNPVWPSWRNTSVKAAVEAKNEPAALAKVITDHIAETTAAFRGRVVDWDVINETFTNHDLMKFWAGTRLWTGSKRRVPAIRTPSSSSTTSISWKAPTRLTRTITLPPSRT
jgi:GH35 family endo-1,4-beta-xylanase